MPNKSDFILLHVPLENYLDFGSIKVISQINQAFHSKFTNHITSIGWYSPDLQHKIHCYKYKKIFIQQPIEYIHSQITHLEVKTFDYPETSLASLSSLTHLTCTYFSVPLPKTLTHLKILYTYFGTPNFQFSHIPSTLTHLILESYNFVYTPYCLPNSLIYLSMARTFTRYLYLVYNQPLPGLPPKLTHLEFSKHFSQPVDELPPLITHLSFGKEFNYPVNNLPSSITHIKFYLEKGHFNQRLTLPPKVVHLTLSDAFNQPIINFPHTITHLIFGFNFNQDVLDLPPFLTHLKFGHCFNLPAISLPSTLVQLEFGTTFNNKVNFHELINLKSLVFGSHYSLPTTFPPSLTYLQLGKNFNDTLDNNLPATLTHLVFMASSFNQPIDDLPSSLLYLDLNSFRFNQPVNKLPSKLIHLNLGKAFNKPIISLPPSLTFLKLGKSFSHEIIDKLPASLNLLFLSKSYKSEMEISKRNITIYYFSNTQHKAGNIDIDPTAPSCQIPYTSILDEMSKTKYNIKSFSYGGLF